MRLVFFSFVPCFKGNATHAHLETILRDFPQVEVLAYFPKTDSTNLFIKVPSSSRFNYQFYTLYPKTSSWLARGRNYLSSRLVNHFSKISDFRPNFILFNEGIPFTAAQFSPITKYLEQTQFSYQILVHQQSDAYIPNNAVTREKLRMFYDKATHLFFISRNSLHTTERHLDLKFRNAFVIQNPISCCPEALPWPKGETISFALPARYYAPDKGQDLLLEALAQVDFEKRNWEFNFYGFGPDRSYFESLAKHYGINRHVYFHPFEPEVTKIWMKNHLLVMPSRKEGNSIAFVESMALGRPSLVSTAGGFLEWVQDGETGFIADASHPQTLSNHISRAVKAFHRWKTMGEKALQFYKTNHDPHPTKTLLEHLWGLSF